MIFEAIQNEIFFFLTSSRANSMLSPRSTRQDKHLYFPVIRQRTSCTYACHLFQMKTETPRVPMWPLLETFCRSPSRLISSQTGLLSPTWKTDFERGSCFVLLFFCFKSVCTFPFSRFVSTVHHCKVG